MDSKIKLFIERASNELRLAKAIFELSSTEKTKIQLGANPDDTFYSAVISHCYYCIFYSAKAILLSANIPTSAPEEHKKTYEEFKKNFIDNQRLELELLNIYKDFLIKADELLSLFSEEKYKRGHFTYKTLAQANIRPASESIQNATKFLKNIRLVLKI